MSVFYCYIEGGEHEYIKERCGKAVTAKKQNNLDSKGPNSALNLFAQTYRSHVQEQIIYATQDFWHGLYKQSSKLPKTGFFI